MQAALSAHPRSVAQYGLRDGFEGKHLSIIIIMYGLRCEGY
jgi:hypothetical protein